jgi:preprotein translocase subunit SecD
MTNKNSLVKILSLVTVLLLAFLYAWPNVYREYPVVEISGSNATQTANLGTKVKTILDENHLNYQRMDSTDDQFSVVFKNTDDQLLAKDVLQKVLGNDYTVALNLVSSMPAWLKSIGAHPMKLGLDLKGGVHFLLDVDMQSVIKHQYEDVKKNIANTLKQKHIYVSGMRVQPNAGILIRLRDSNQAEEAIALLNAEYPKYFTTFDKQHGWLQIKINAGALQELRQATLEQTMSILRHRVNELGVAEAVVQQQGEHRIAVDLHGIQDAARA